MARYTGPVCKLCRREGVKLYLKGDRCFSAKCAIENRAHPPGMHGQKRSKRLSDYGVRLREKQKLRRIYSLGEGPFRKLFAEAAKRKGVTGATFLVLLEQRLDSVVLRLGLANSRAQARQLIGHGHYTVNGKRVTIPSYRVRPGDEITVAKGSEKLVVIQQAVAAARRRKGVPWLEFNPDALKGRFVRTPSRDDLVLPVNEQLIVEYYSR
ncbi:MAG: 30S ribosomal protein S4 [Deinococcus sp.]|nr:30S ribosomal protein S4 [Deinococcus sp.]